MADLVSEMREGKHYYRQGIEARECIEYYYTGENQYEPVVGAVARGDVTVLKMRFVAFTEPPHLW